MVGVDLESGFASQALGVVTCIALLVELGAIPLANVVVQNVTPETRIARGGVDVARSTIGINRAAT